MSQSPPQNPTDYPLNKGSGAPTERANSINNPTGLPPAHDSAGYLRNSPMPVPYGRYDPSMGQNPPVPGFGWNDPVLMEVQRKRFATRRVSVSSGNIGLIAMIIQVFITTSIFVAVSLSGQQYMGIALLSLLMMIVAPFIVGLGWVVTFILALIACIRAHARTPRVQPDGWVEAKTPTSALLAASIVAGLPILIAYVTLFSSALFDSSYDFSESLLRSLFFACDLVEALMAVGFVFLLRMSKALDPAVRGSQPQGTQPA